MKNTKLFEQTIKVLVGDESGYYIKASTDIISSLN